MKRRLSALFAAVVVSLACLVPSQAQAAETNVVPDPVLRQCIAQAMHQAATGGSPGTTDYSTEADSISQADLQALVDASKANGMWGVMLNCGSGIASLEGLQYLVGQNVNLIAPSGTISDLSPLNGLNISALILSNNDISDLSPLADMRGVSWLDVSGTNHVTDLSPLSGWTGGGLVNDQPGALRLDVTGNPVSDLSPLSKIRYLQLEAGYTNVSDVSVFSGKVGAGGLWTQPGFATGESRFVWFDVRGAHVADLSVVSGLCTQAQAEAIVNGHGESADCVGFDAAFQTLTGSAMAGSPVALPRVNGQSDDPVVWKVMQGDATLNSDGTVTYSKPGTYVLQFQDRAAKGDDGTLSDGGGMVCWGDPRGACGQSGRMRPTKRCVGACGHRMVGRGSHLCERVFH